MLFSTTSCLVGIKMASNLSTTEGRGIPKTNDGPKIRWGWKRRNFHTLETGVSRKVAGSVVFFKFQAPKFGFFK